ncbi:MAG: VWA domain-containing protein, partial [Fusobacteriaceae bacterium]|nr:VWA domain-containing protein [Fusobacteriaceae bacterium]
MFRFAQPYLLLLAPALAWMFFRKRKEPAIRFPSIEAVRKYRLRSKKYLIGKLLFFLSGLLMIAALARPQLQLETSVTKKNGISIAIVLDLSQSMLKDDFRPNRLEAAKTVLDRFVQKRPDDLISLVVFGGDAYTKAPLTFDHTVITEIVRKLTVDDITSNQQTAIGMGLGVSLNRLKEAKTKEKIAILLTDGENNSGEMSPEAAAKLAKELGIKVYTVGIGARELLVRDFFFTRRVQNTELDESLLEWIAKETGGQYFRAGDEKEFNGIFDTIDRLEKTEVEG